MNEWAYSLENFEIFLLDSCYKSFSVIYTVLPYYIVIPTKTVGLSNQEWLDQELCCIVCIETVNYPQTTSCCGQLGY